ncbi:hypothetical protein D1BOALGB6SA_9522 [Olavius sp. associated proteobacterium Delta 1]|nr:hypothetical protein D1BOALGB6SA_9522 [Olavius sp. associated proteobacterium Delta 1]
MAGEKTNPLIPDIIRDTPMKWFGISLGRQIFADEHRYKEIIAAQMAKIQELINYLSQWERLLAAILN